MQTDAGEPSMSDATAAPMTSGMQLAQAPFPAPIPQMPPQPPANPPQAQPLAPPAPAASAPSAAQLNDADTVLTLIRSTMIALNQANFSGNYTVLRDTASPRFREVNTAADLARIFAPIRAANIDLGIAAVADPHLTTAALNDQKMLYLVGSFETKPAAVRYELLFEPLKNRWQLFGISVMPVNAVPPPPVAPQAKPKAPPRTPAKAAPAKARDARPNPAPAAVAPAPEQLTEQ